jgi:hypothetical protein
LPSPVSAVVLKPGCFSGKLHGKTHFDLAFLSGKGQKKQGLKSEIDFSLADALAARYDTVTIRVSLSYAASASYLMTLIKPA